MDSLSGGGGRQRVRLYKLLPAFLDQTVQKQSETIISRLAFKAIVNARYLISDIIDDLTQSSPFALAGKRGCGKELPAYTKYCMIPEGARSMRKKRFASVWDAIENTPAQAENMKLRSALMMALKDHIARTGLSQSEAAKLLGVTQPRISDLMRGKIELFGLDTLVNMIGAAGLHVEMRISDAA